MNKLTKNLTIDYIHKFEDNQIYVDVIFKNIDCSGAQISGSVFINCTFNNVILYWGFGDQVRFINCEFNGSDLRLDFYNTIFSECKFNNCNVGENNLGGDTIWTDCDEIDCVVIGSRLPIFTTDELLKSAQQEDASEPASPAR